MKRSSLITFAVLLLFASGCSAPNYYRRDNMDCYHKDKGVSRDFKGNIINKEYAVNLKNKVGDYLSRHPETSEEYREALINLRVAKGMTGEQVKLLLGDPERAQPLNSGNKFRADQRWVYMMKDTVCIYVVPIPLFFTHNAYHLYFKNNILVAIEEVKLKYS